MHVDYTCKEQTTHAWCTSRQICHAWCTADPWARCALRKNPHARCTRACKGGARVHELGHAPPLLTPKFNSLLTKLECAFLARFFAHPWFMNEQNSWIFALNHCSIYDNDTSIQLIKVHIYHRRNCLTMCWNVVFEFNVLVNINSTHTIIHLNLMIQNQWSMIHENKHWSKAKVDTKFAKCAIIGHCSHSVVNSLLKSSRMMPQSLQMSMIITEYLLELFVV